MADRDMNILAVYREFPQSLTTGLYQLFDEDVYSGCAYAASDTNKPQGRMQTITYCYLCVDQLKKKVSVFYFGNSRQYIKAFTVTDNGPPPLITIMHVALLSGLHVTSFVVLYRVIKNEVNTFKNLFHKYY
jgi:hypothetical protein